MPFGQVDYVTHFRTCSPVLCGGKKDFPQISAKLITNSDVQLECVIEGSVKSVGKQRQEQYCKIA